jgi:hypothetical protein
MSHNSEKRPSCKIYVLAEWSDSLRLVEGARTVQILLALTTVMLMSPVAMPPSESELYRKVIVHTQLDSGAVEYKSGGTLWASCLAVVIIKVLEHIVVVVGLHAGMKFGLMGVGS